MEVKQNFSALVAEALSEIRHDDCINLDTGDGMAICYLGDPEDILFIGIGLKDAFADLLNTCSIVYKVRLGINSGPVKIIEDINGQRNTIGDGINVAQRIMNFADDIQLLVSRSFYDVVSCMSDECKNMFHYLERHSDKHVRKHAVYEVVSRSGVDEYPDVKESESLLQESSESDSRNNIESIAETVSSLHNNVACIFDMAALNIIEKELAGYVGPIAKFLIKKAVVKACSQDELRRMRADEISDKNDRSKFLSM